MITVTITLLLALVGLFFFWLWRMTKTVDEFFSSRGIPQLKQSLSTRLGIDSFLLKQSPNDFYITVYNGLAGKKIGGISLLGQPILVVRDPELIQRVLVQDFDKFTDRGMPADIESNPLEGHLFNLSGPPWRALRYKLSPAFTGSKLRWMSGLISECAGTLHKKLEEAIEKSSTLNMGDWLSRFTTDVIASTAFGVEAGALENADCEFRAMSRKALEISPGLMVVFIFRMICPRLSSAMRLQTISREVTHFFYSVSRQVVRRREETGEKRRDFVQLLVELRQRGFIQLDKERDEEDEEAGHLGHTEGLTIELTDEVLAAQCFVFFVAGFETTASSLGFAMHFLSEDPERQEELRREVRRLKEKYDGRVDYDTVKEAVYLECCISEALRLFPPFGFLTRECTDDYTFPDGMRIPKKTPLVIPLWGLQMDPDLFPEPEKFRPERFMTDDGKYRKPREGTYLPFGDGPRMCIGKRFALLEAKLALLTIVDNFKILPVEEREKSTPQLMTHKIVAQPVGGFYFKLQKLENGQ